MNESQLKKSALFFACVGLLLLYFTQSFATVPERDLFEQYNKVEVDALIAGVIHKNNKTIYTLQVPIYGYSDHINDYSVGDQVFIKGESKKINKKYGIVIKDMKKIYP